jgi:hypothetical protein
VLMSISEVAIIDSIVAQTEAMNMNDTGIYHLIKDDELWNFGNDNLRLNGSYRIVLKKMINWLVVSGVHIHTNAPVSLIHQKNVAAHHADSGATITYSKGKKMFADRVVVTVPPTVLRGPKPILTMVPKLPMIQQKAIDERNFGRAIKVYALCKNGYFWKNQTSIAAAADTRNNIKLIFCCDPNMIFSQIWFDERSNYNEVLICGFVTSTRADDLANACSNNSSASSASSAFSFSASNNKIEQLFVSQLDQMFGTKLIPKPCTNVLIKTTSYDWGQHPYINGGYSSPQINQSDRDSKELMRNVHGCVHFAGEATDSGACATTQSAMLTGERAASEVLDKLISKDILNKKQIGKL